ncbi:MAG: prophage regulatory protein [Arenicella sp.]|jgi:prophage regulatory protein
MSTDNQNKRSCAPFPIEGFVRLYQIIGDPKRGIAPFFPVSRSQWFLGVKQGIYPQGQKLSSRIAVWKASDVRNLIDSLSTEVA